MIEIISIIPSPVTPNKILEITINYEGNLYNGLIIKQEDDKDANNV